jgi:hypothetical protein
MALLVSMPVEIYDGLLQKCSKLSREYLILKNGIVRRDREEDSAAPIVEILCEAPRAKFLLDFATLVYPPAASYIEESIKLARED